MDEIISEIMKHAEEVQPNECCGFVMERDGVKRYVRCENKAEGAHRFVISTEDYVDAVDSGELKMIAHSHVYEPATPSDGDRVGIETTDLPWLIVNWPTGAYTITEPSGYVAPLIGREFQEGVLDCYALVRDYFAQELTISLPDYVRPEGWVESGRSILLENFAAFGFKETSMDDLQPNDCFLMQVGAQIPNHCAVYVGDGMILHHVSGRLSGKDVYGQFWRRATTHVLRYVGAKV